MTGYGPATALDDPAFATAAHCIAETDRFPNAASSMLLGYRTPLALTNRIDHLERLFSGLLAPILDRTPRVLLAAGSYIGEGFDDSRLDTLFLTMPISWHRIHHGKKIVRIFDYVDAQVPMLGRMLEKWLNGYRAIG